MILYRLVRVRAPAPSATEHPLGGHVYVRTQLDAAHELEVWQQGAWWYWSRSGPNPTECRSHWTTIHAALMDGRRVFEREFGSMMDPSCYSDGIGG